MLGAYAYDREHLEKMHQVALICLKNHPDPNAVDRFGQTFCAYEKNIYEFAKKDLEKREEREEREIDLIIDKLYDRSYYHDSMNGLKPKPIKELSSLMDILQNITETQIKNYATKELETNKLTNLSFLSDNKVNISPKQFDIIDRSVDKISYQYRKIDKTQKTDCILNIYNDIKQINLSKYKKDEKGYEFVKHVQSFQLTQVLPEKINLSLMEKLNDIMIAKGEEYGIEKIKDYAKGKLKDTAFFVAKVATAPHIPLNMAVRGIEKISNAYDKIDKTEEIKFINSIYEDVKQIDLNQYSPEETGYEFVKSIQQQSSEEEIAAFHDRVNLVADTIQEGY